MLLDTLTLNVDVLNNGTVVPHVISRYEETQNRSVYVSTTHTPALRDQLAFFRSLPTRAGNFKGVQKTSFKFTKDITVPGVDATTNVSSALIVEVSFSVPAGLSSDVVKTARQKVIALLDDDSVMDKLNIQLMV